MPESTSRYRDTIDIAETKPGSCSTKSQNAVSGCCGWTLFTRPRIDHGAVKQRGHILVEFAMVLPIVATMSFAMVELSRFMLLQHTADTAAYEGARHAIVPGATSSEAIVATDELIKANGLRNVIIEVTPTDLTEDTPVVTVRVEIPIFENSWVPLFSFLGHSVSSEVSLYCERPAIIKLSGRPVIKFRKQGLLGL